MKIKGILFDFDGTLVQSNGLKSRGFYEVTKHIPSAAQVLNELFSTHPHLDRFGVLEVVAQRTQVKGEAQSLIQAYSEWVNNALKTANKVSGVQKFLKTMKNAGVEMAICSATPQQYIEKAVEISNLGVGFSYIFGGPSSKSDGARFILEAWQIRSDEVVFIGDGESDRLAAESLNCRFIAIKNMYNNFSTEPEETFSSYDEFCGISRFI